MSDETVDQVTEPTAPAATEPEQSNDTQPETTAVEEEFEFESDDGEKLRLPKKLQPAVLRRQDYTRKTQDLAEERRKLEAERQTEKQALEREREVIASSKKLAALEVELEQFKGVTPDQWAIAMRNAQTEEEFRNVSAQKARFDALQYQYSQERMNVEQDARRRAFEAQQMTAKQLEQAMAEVKAAIPDWSEKKSVELMGHAKALGASEKAAMSVKEAWIVKALHESALYRQSLKSATAAPPPAPATPIRTITGKQSAVFDESKLSMDEWVKWRNKQVRGKA